LWCSVLPLLAARTVEAEPNISATATMIRSLLDIVILLEKSVDAMKTRRCRRLFLSGANLMLNHAFLKHW